MFFIFIFIGLLGIYFYLWGDYIKILIFLEILSLMFIVIFLLMIKLEFFTLNYFFGCLIFLVCESSLGFLLFIFYIRIENEVVKKLNLIQF